MVPRKFRVSEICVLISKSRRRFERVSKSCFLVYLCVSNSQIFGPRTWSLGFFFFQYSDWLSRYLRLPDVRVAKNLRDVFCKKLSTEQKYIFNIKISSHPFLCYNSRNILDNLMTRPVFRFVLLSYSSYCFKHWGHCLIHLSFVY